MMNMLLQEMTQAVKAIKFAKVQMIQTRWQYHLIGIVLRISRNFQNSGHLYHFDGDIDDFQVHASAVSASSTDQLVRLSENLRDSVASGNTVYLSSSTGVNSLSSAVSADDL